METTLASYRGEEMADEEKITKVIELFDKGLDVEEVAYQVGYSNSRSLSRFMRRSNYGWDKYKKNYVLADDYEAKPNKASSKAETQEIQSQPMNQCDPLDLLENPKVLSALQQSDILLNLIDSHKIKESKTNENNEKASYGFWKKAQDFAFMRKASYTTSVRLPVELNDRLNRFKESSNLTQTQIICMSLDYFMERFESKI